MDLTPVLPDLLAAARVGLDPGDAGLAVDPSGTRTLALIDRGAALSPELVRGLARVLNGLGVPAVLLLRRPSGRPAVGDRTAWADLRGLVDERLLPDTLVVGDVQAWSLRHDRPVLEVAGAGTASSGPGCGSRPDSPARALHP